jgi:hypothetical protein
MQYGGGVACAGVWHPGEAAGSLVLKCIQVSARDHYSVLRCGNTDQEAEACWLRITALRRSCTRPLDNVGSSVTQCDIVGAPAKQAQNLQGRCMKSAQGGLVQVHMHGSLAP